MWTGAGFVLALVGLVCAKKYDGSAGIAGVVAALAGVVILAVKLS